MKRVGEMTRRFVGIAALFTVLISLSALLMMAKQEHDKEIAFFQSFNAMKLTPPTGKPAITQESIDIALMVYGIAVPDGVNHPVLDSEIQERGRTIYDLAKENTDVKIGKSAFNSWAVLGSTLAHEIEIHTQQSILVINIMDMFGLNGTLAAERLAYAYELVNASRFGLSKQDLVFIENTVHTFYPLKGTESVYEKNFAAKALEIIEEE